MKGRGAVAVGDDELVEYMARKARKKGAFLWLKKIERDGFDGLPKKNRKQSMEEISNATMRALQKEHLALLVRRKLAQDDDDDDDELQDSPKTAENQTEVVRVKAKEDLSNLSLATEELHRHDLVALRDDAAASVGIKPKYITQVFTGYTWNKYNRAHYDHDNLPSKAVQGYKFIVKYLELHDRTKIPTFTTKKDGDISDTCSIRFRANAAYEDLLFRIVNDEWENSHKKGFKCAFENGILHLYFNFKRPPYHR